MWGCRGLSCAARVLLGVPRASGGWTSGRRPLQPGEWRRAAGCPAGKRAGLRSENVPSPFWRSPRPRCAAGEAPFLARKAWRTAARENGRAGAGRRVSGSCVNVIFRNLDTAADCSLSYKELKGLLKSKTTLIDVREKWEIGQFGKIPGSVNIPLGEVVEALQMNPKDFKERYNQDMPAKSDHLVFSCMAGVRSKKALDIAMSLGFSRVQHYAGGLEEWAKYESPEKKQSR